MKFRKYKIEKGSHRSGLYFKPYFSRTKISYEVAFTRSCLYRMVEEDQLVINRLFGLSFGYHESNSASFGWRSFGKVIEISAYNYINSKKETKKIAHLSIDQIYLFDIVVLPASITFRIRTDIGETIIFHQIPRTKGVWSCGYELFPYFGNRRPAPQNIEIFMRRS